MRLLELHLLSADLLETEKFYSGVLGLPLKEKNEALLAYAVGYSLLVFHRVTGCQPVYHFAFTVPNNKIEESFG